MNRPVSLKMLVLLLATSMIAAGACAQTPTLTLPEALIGTWQPYGKGYKQFGDLVIGKDVLSWSVCQNVRYRVFKRTADTYYIEQTDPSPCDFSFVGTKYLVLVLKDKELEASICRERDEFDRPPTEKYCSWGILNKKNDSTPVTSSSN